MADDTLKSDVSNLPYRPCVGIMLLNKQGLVFVGKRIQTSSKNDSNDHYAWQMPQGGIDRGETSLEAAKRELEEETNVKTATMLAESPHWYQYELPLDPYGRSVRGRYRGQTQKWFAFRFEGLESEINIQSPRHATRPEFADWRWEKMERLPELIIPFKRYVYEQVVADFRHLSKI